MDETCCTPRAPVTRDASLTLEDEERLALFCKALGHPSRVRIMRILLEKQECV